MSFLTIAIQSKNQSKNQLEVSVRSFSALSVNPQQMVSKRSALDRADAGDRRVACGGELVIGKTIFEIASERLNYGRYGSLPEPCGSTDVKLVAQFVLKAVPLFPRPNSQARLG